MSEGLSPGDPGAFSVRPLRTCLDWFTVLWKVWVSSEVWARLSALAARGEVVTLPGRMGDPVPLVGRRRGRDVVFMGHGVYICVRDPDGQGDASGSGAYGAELQVQGTAFAGSPGGGESLVWDLLYRTEELLWEEVGETDLDRRVLLDPSTRVGRLDIACDCAFANDDNQGSRWIEGGIYADGDHDGSIKRFLTRAKKSRTERDGKNRTSKVGKGEVKDAGKGRTSMLGKERAGRTLYLGTGGSLELCVYERDKLKRGDWAILAETYKVLGWNEVDRIVRWEARTSRAWYRDQRVTLEDGREVTADTLTVGQMLGSLRVLALAIARRWRHTDPSCDENRRRKDRDSSPWQNAVNEGVMRWRDMGGDMCAVVSKRREAALNRAGRRTLGGAVDYLALKGIPLESYADYMPALLARLLDPFERSAWERRHSRGVQRYAVERPAREVVASAA